jgi:hypothetical protein
MDPADQRGTMTPEERKANAAKQAAWRTRRKIEAEQMQQQLDDLKGRLAAEQATSADLREQIAALARHIAQFSKE